MTATTTQPVRRELLNGRVDRSDFRHAAACRGVDPELFFPAAESGPVHDAQVRAAVAVCAGCPVRGECLTWALSALPDGIAGGMTAQQRRTERARRARTRRRTTRTTKGEGAPAGTGAPSQVSHNTNAWAGIRAVEGHRG